MATNFLILALSISLLGGYLVRSTQMQLQLRLISAIMAGMMRLVPIILVIIIVVAISFFLLALLPKSKLITQIMFLIALIIGTILVRKTDGFVFSQIASNSSFNNGN